MKTAKDSTKPVPFDSSFTPAIAAATAPIYERLRQVIPAPDWQGFAPYVKAINELKHERNAIILAHNYQTPEIFHGVADIVGDSLSLAREAARCEADIIIQCGVMFMAETAKILNPNKTVLIPDKQAGCSLAASITADDVRELRRRHPGVPIVTYVNSSAEVKAESDICCTSSNAQAIIESLKTSPVLCIPDEYLAHNVNMSTDVEVLSWHGRCEVHERFSAEELQHYRLSDPEIAILAHPECSPDVVTEANFTGSTSAMINWVKQHQPNRVILITECSMSDNVAVEHPNIEFIRPCNLCPHMKRITLKGIYNCLRDGQHEIVLDDAIAARARVPIERMLAIG